MSVTKQFFTYGPNLLPYTGNRVLAALVSVNFKLHTDYFLSLSLLISNT